MCTILISHLILIIAEKSSTANLCKQLEDHKLQINELTIKRDVHLKKVS